MRTIENPQYQFGQVDISTIEFNLRSRDELPQVLRGLQHIYVNEAVRKAVFELLETDIAPERKKNNGRPGLELWKILVIGVLRLDLNWDYDRLHDEVNNHKKIRQMLGHGDWADETHYSLQRLKDNVRLLTPELLDKLNQLVVKSGHEIVKKKESEVLRGRCDSFVVETNVHYPTDINLLWDAMRKTLRGIADLCDSLGMEGYRQSEYTLRQFKKKMRECQQKKRSKAKGELQQSKQEKAIIKAHTEYLHLSRAHITKAQNSLREIEEKKLPLSTIQTCAVQAINGFIIHALRQYDQIERRILKGEIIPQPEKVYSIFEPHTEWVCKGKAGVPVELGLRVCVMEDQYQFILHHHVMEKITDDQTAVSMISETKKRFSTLDAVSFDKGFHSPVNQVILKTQLTDVVLPRKGKLSEANKIIESSDEFRRARYQHSAIESAINALEVHGLDRCPDKGIEGFKRYIGLAVVARNLQIIGAILTKQARDTEKKRQIYYAHTALKKRAA